MLKKHRAASTSLLLIFMSSACFALSGVAYVEVAGAYTGVAKPMEFYLHYIDAPVYVAGLETKHIMNTTKFFKFLTQEQAYANSFYKSVGQPKVVIDFYLCPNLAGPVSIDGSWQVFIWVNSSAYKPSDFNLQFKEVTVGGATLWDSGLLNPTVTSSIGRYIDVPVYNYNLSTPLTHTFNANTTLLVEVTVNAGASADTRIWYDSPLYPSKVILPLEDYARPISVKTYDANYTETYVFSVFWNESQRKVIVQANVTDPLGGYDVYMVNVTIRNPEGQAVLNGATMTRITDSMWKTRYSHIYEAVWPYSHTAMSGTYTVEVSVVDNNGYHHQLNYGVFDPHVEYGYQDFSIGVQYQVQIRTIDTHNQSLADAEVRAVSDGVTLAQGHTNASGWWEKGLWAGYYNITVYWYETEVAKEPIQVTEASNFTVQCKIYYPSFKIVDDVNETLPESEVYVKSPNGTTSFPPFYTNSAGFINLTQVPNGNYTLTILWKGIIVQNTTLNVDSDGPFTIKTHVYKLTVKVLGNNVAPVQGAYVIIYTQSGFGYGFELSDATGQTTFKLPEGTYKIDVRFSSVYWLSIVTASATNPSYTINSSGPLTITLTDFPPPIWTTLGFMLLILLFLLAVIIAVFMVLRHRKRLK